jgi:hypothetical protein
MTEFVTLTQLNRLKIVKVTEEPTNSSKMSLTFKSPTARLPYTKIVTIFLSAPRLREEMLRNLLTIGNLPDNLFCPDRSLKEGEITTKGPIVSFDGEKCLLSN